MQIVAFRFRSRTCAQHLRTSALRLVPGGSRGISLLEVLIAMFIMLFGLMGVAAIFPVGSHYVVEGDKKDRSSNLAQIAFEEIVARGILEPARWILTDHPQDYFFPTWIIDRQTPSTIGQFQMRPNDVPGGGNAFVIDPLGGSQTSAQRVFFPVRATAQERQNPWNNLLAPLRASTQPWQKPRAWPVVRLTLPMNNPTGTSSFAPQVAMTAAIAETVFRLRDDLSQDMPPSGDQPSIQRWSVDTASGQLLARQYKGDYSWLATVVPSSGNALLGLQPAARLYDEYYEVAAVVFYKRDITPSASTTGSPGSERLIAGEFLGQGELFLYDVTANDPDAVDNAVDGLKPSNWICVMGVRPTDGLFLMKWYKLLALDDETDTLPYGTGTLPNGTAGRYATVQGPDWPTSSLANLRVAILPGAIDVYTQVMKLDVSN